MQLSLGLLGILLYPCASLIPPNRFATENCNSEFKFLYDKYYRLRSVKDSATCLSSPVMDMSSKDFEDRFIDLNRMDLFGYEKDEISDVYASSELPIPLYSESCIKSRIVPQTFTITRIEDVHMVSPGIEVVPIKGSPGTIQLRRIYTDTCLELPSAEERVQYESSQRVFAEQARLEEKSNKKEGRRGKNSNEDETSSDGEFIMNFFTLVRCQSDKNEQLFRIEPLLTSSSFTFPEKQPDKARPGLNAVPRLSHASPYTPPNPSLYPVPDTCKPIQLEHVGRHGSRNVDREQQLSNGVGYLAEADSKGWLNPQGQQIMHWLLTLMNVKEKVPYSHLTQLGYQELYNITRRMYDLNEELFKKATPDRPIQTSETIAMRTAQSRDATVLALIQSGIPENSVKINKAPSMCDIEYGQMRSWDNCKNYLEYKKQPGTFNDFNTVIQVFSAMEGGAVDNIHDKLFTEEYLQRKSVIEPGLDRFYFVSYLWLYGCGLEAAMGHEAISDICSLFDEVDLNMLEYMEDMRGYTGMGRVEEHNITYTQGCYLLDEVRKGLQGAVDGDDQGPVHLRFSHKETLMPVLGLLYVAAENPYSLVDADYERRAFKLEDLAPLAGNLQWIMYQCDEGEGKDVYRVKFLVNEREYLLPNCDEVYCDWSRVDFLLKEWSCTGDELTEKCGEMLTRDCN